MDSGEHPMFIMARPDITDEERYNKVWQMLEAIRERAAAAYSVTVSSLCVPSIMLLARYFVEGTVVAETDFV